MQKENVAKICKALGDYRRLSIIEMLTRGEKCACELLEAFDISQPTLSHHMKILSSCNLIRTRKEGKWSYYAINCDTMIAYRTFISGLVCTTAPNSHSCCSQ